MSHHLVGVTEIAEILGVHRQRVHQLAVDPGFPQPTVVLSGGQRIWVREAILSWQGRERGINASPPKVPARDPDRPTDDPWDAWVVRFLLATPDGRSWRRGDLMECLRRQPNRVARQPGRVAEAAALAERYGVECRSDPGGKTIHFFLQRSTEITFPQSAAERRSLLRR
jgi:predicted DNA-binding transcriptional regulator AlpA